jgi:hypothetical protein
MAPIKDAIFGARGSVIGALKPSILTTVVVINTSFVFAYSLLE